ncbi:hypothetical protein [Acetanaerobacterium elongatum]|uniref:Uncharacterized protein n=1 Tax=Acetanaerobacterium elongatum TaxID=258515 RepID=A0A1H0EKF7_9FIRM|nr:hypothetical protein [Acetanaerobacterium elongatum]SDN82841.1 hypothetical protein SAMN05192585_13414 [Acetanaerobacterium elongatum]
MRSSRLRRSFICIITCTMLMCVQPLTVFAAESVTNHFASVNHITKQIRQNHIPNHAVSIVKGDKLFYSKGYGSADITPFEIGNDADAHSSIVQIIIDVFKRLKLLAPDILRIIHHRQPSAHNPQGAFILLFNMCYLLITFLLVASIIRLRDFRKRINKSKLGFYSNVAFTVLINLMLPVVLLISAPALLKASWKAAMIPSPDMAVVLALFSAVLFVTGILKSRISLTTIQKNRMKSRSTWN